MTEPTPSRRDLLRAGGGLASLAALGGCLESLTGGGGSGDDALDSVPAGADAVANVDVTRVLADDTFRERVESMDGGMGTGPAGLGSFDEALDTVETQIGLDPRALSEATAFGQLSSGGWGGLIVESDWPESDLVATVEDTTSPLEETTYADRTVYEAEGGAIAVLSEGTYAFTSTNVVRDVVDVAAGDADAVGGTVRDAYADTRDGYARFAAVVPDEFGDEEVAMAGTTLADLEYVAGALYRGGGSRGGEITLKTTSASVASDLADRVEGGLNIAGRQMAEAGPRSGMDEEMLADFEAMIEATTVSQDGSTITVANDDGRGFMPLVPLAVVGSFFLGLGEQAQPVQPTVSFSTDYDRDAGTLTITHNSGDHVPVEELYVRGAGLASTGAWTELGGSASGDVDGRRSVVAGDSVTLDVQPDYVVRVVWESSADDASATLAANRGPEA